MPDILSIVLRSLSFLFLLQAAGIALFVAIFGRHLGTRRAIGRVGVMSALFAVVATVGHFALEAARMAGEFSGIMDVSLQKVTLSSSAGAAFGLRMLGLVLIGAAVAREGEVSAIVGIVGATLAVVAFTLTGHTSVHPDRWILAALLSLHLLIVAFWLGSLPALYLSSLRDTPSEAARILEGFSRVAAWLVPGIFLAGLGMTLLLVPRLSAFRQPYGEILIFKVAAFAALMGLAALNKWRIVPAIVRGERSALLSIRRSIATEYAAIAGVLVATATMTTLFSPE